MENLHSSLFNFCSRAPFFRASFRCIREVAIGFTSDSQSWPMPDIKEMVKLMSMSLSLDSWEMLGLWKIVRELQIRLSARRILFMSLHRFVRHWKSGEFWVRNKVPLHDFLSKPLQNCLTLKGAQNNDAFGNLTAKNLLLNKRKLIAISIKFLWQQQIFLMSSFH